MSETFEILKIYPQLRTDHFALRSEYNILQNKYKKLLDGEIQHQPKQESTGTSSSDMQRQIEQLTIVQQELIEGLNKANESNRLLNLENQRYTNEIQTAKIDYEVLLADYENTKEENKILSEQHRKLLNFLSSHFNVDPSDSVDNIIENVRLFVADSEQNVETMRSRINQIEMSTEKKEDKLNKIIETLHAQMSREQKLIDTELVMYDDDMKYNDQNPLKLEDFVDVFEYTFDAQIDSGRLPFFKFLSGIVNDDIGADVNDFNVIDENTGVYYHAYTILIVKLMSMYSKSYIRNYIEYLYNRCNEALRSNSRSIDLPKLVHPQTFQINSMYYLMNRYNTKCYDPDRVTDFSNFIINLLKPEYRPDTTKALNLFQPGIGKRYNSIQIYTPETIKTLEDLQKTIGTLLDE